MSSPLCDSALIQSSEATVKRMRENALPRRRVKLFTAAGISLALMILFSMTADVEGSLTNKTIQGHIQDTIGTPLSGADVTIEIWGGFWPDQDFLRTTSSTVSDAYGNYEVTINSNYWDPHNTIKVIVTYGPDEGTRSVEANDQEYQTVDVTISVAIPEFSNLPGLLVAICGCAVSVLLLGARRRRLV